MTEHSYSGKCAFNLGGQTLFWNTGVAGVYTEDPATLTEETIAAATVAEGDTVGDASDTTYWTGGEGPVECVLITSQDIVIYAGTPFFRADGTLVTVHPTQAQIEASVTPGTAPVYTPESPNEITGEYGTDDGTILAGVVAVLASLGLVTDSTTSPE